MEKSKPILGYRDIRGRGQSIRALLAYLEIEYTNKFYKYDGPPPTFFSDAWKEDKLKLELELPFPNLPYWLEGDVKLTEASAIIRHLARENDPSLIPQDKAKELDLLDSVIMDVRGQQSNLYYFYSDELAATVDPKIHDKLVSIAKYLGNKKWLLGDKLTYVDFLFHELLYRQNKYKSETLSPFPTLVAYKKQFEAIPAIARFIDSPDYISSPCVGAAAKLRLY